MSREDTSQAGIQVNCDISVFDVMKSGQRRPCDLIVNKRFFSKRLSMGTLTSQGSNSPGSALPKIVPNGKGEQLSPLIPLTLGTRNGIDRSDEEKPNCSLSPAE